MRKTLIVSTMLLLLSFVVFQACSNQPTSTKQTQAKMSDSDLKNSIAIRFNGDPQIKQADISISADADKNQATLSGTVSSEVIRLRAIALAKGAQDGLVVVDKIDVKPSELARTNYDDYSEYTQEMAKDAREQARAAGDKIGDSMEDAWLHTKIVAKLVANSKTPGRKINVDVVNNVVTLRGTVDTAEQKAEAERIAKETDRVKSVANLLKLGKGY